MPTPASEYIGDGVYAHPGSFKEQLRLTTENGMKATNEIFLEPSHLDRIVAYSQSELQWTPRAAKLSEETVTKAKADAWDEAVKTFAVWKDGEQFTAMGRPIKEALKLNPYREES